MTTPPLSPLQLKDHTFTNLRVKYLEGGNASASPALKPGIAFERVPNSPNQWRIALSLELRNADPSKPFLYEADIHVRGTFEVNDGFPPEKKEQLAIVNGASILYSAAREMLLNVTTRFPHGGLNLPTLTFVKLVADALKQKASSQQVSPPVPPPPLQPSAAAT